MRQSACGTNRKAAHDLEHVAIEQPRRRLGAEHTQKDEELAIEQLAIAGADSKHAQHAAKTAARTLNVPLSCLIKRKLSSVKLR